MIPHVTKSVMLIFALALLSLSLAGMPSAFAQTETVLYTFTNGTDGSYPSSLVLDSDGNLYGTTSNGGTNFYGNVFKISPTGAFTNLYSFGEYAGNPFAGLAIDGQGNLYGTTFDNGGTVFKLTPSGSLTTLHTFTCQTDGCNPDATLTLDAQGNLYGTTSSGGTNYYGVVFKLTPAGTYSVLYNFTVGSLYDTSSVVADQEGNVYGTTGNAGVSGFGSVFKLTPTGTESTLHSFSPAGRDGFYPYAGVVLDASGNLWGTATNGGTVGAGLLFEVSSTGKETKVHNFAGGADGISPNSGLVFDGSGNLYGTTSYGGTFDLGTVFEVTSAGVEKILHSFAFNRKDGTFPNVGVVLDKNGNIYGSTYQGGNSAACLGGCGVVYKIVP